VLSGIASIVTLSAVALSVGLSACLPSDFDAVERAEHVRENGVRSGAGFMATGSVATAGFGAGADSASAAPAPAAGAGQSGGSGVAGQTPAAMPSMAAGVHGSLAGAAGAAGASTGAGGRSSAPEAGRAAASGGSAAAGVGGAAAEPPGRAGSSAAASGGSPSACGDTTNAADNCGQCGNACSASSALVACVASKCVRACATGYGDCDRDLTSGSHGNGCETDLATDPNNCGGCGMRCDATTGTIASCENSHCVSARVSVGTASLLGTSAHGSASGGTTYEQSCGSQSALVGLDVATDGNAVNGFAAVCAEQVLGGASQNLTVDSGARVALTQVGGNYNPVSRIECPNGSVVIKVGGSTWHFNDDPTVLVIKRLELTCARVTVVKQVQVLFTAGDVVSAGSADDTVDVFSDVCPAGQMVVGFSGRAGAAIDALQTRCAPLTIVQEDAAAP
jgi:hypothetical protein